MNNENARSILPPFPSTENIPSPPQKTSPSLDTTDLFVHPPPLLTLTTNFKTLRFHPGFFTAGGILWRRSNGKMQKGKISVNSALMWVMTSWVEQIGYFGGRKTVGPNQGETVLSVMVDRVVSALESSSSDIVEYWITLLFLDLLLHPEH